MLEERRTAWYKVVTTAAIRITARGDFMSTHGFTKAWEHHVEECKSAVALWRHDATGAELLSCRNADENKVFGVAFRTPPADSTGLPHILEHSVLCGSEKYPVKEPFVELLKGSLQTFLNAFTYPDKTCYPVASANTRDFRNLTDVYLDAVFFPRITEDVFQQEGWHLEPADNGEFVFKGVVYNEMKGVFSSPEAVLGRNSLHELFPDTIYGLESGGDPEVIPSLTYEDFIRFHRAYYHPSNARFFFWGDDDENERLAQVSAAIVGFTRQAPSPAVGLQKRLPAPQYARIPFAAGADESKGMTACNWLLAESSEVETTLGLRMLDHILLGMPASPLRRALIESGLGEDLTGGGLEEELRQSSFSVGLRGIDPTRAEEVEKLILETLQGLARDGIPPLCVEAAINSVEFALREKNTGRFPVGLAVMLQALTTWLHDGDPLASLRYEAPLAAIKQKIASGEAYFESLIRRYFLENTHRATVILTPDPALGEVKEAEERERVKAALLALPANERESLAARAEALKALQEKPDDPAALARIPRLEVADLPPKGGSIPAESIEKSGVPLLFHDLPTSGIAYAEAFFDLQGVPAALYPLLPLMGRALVEMGTKNRDFLDLNMAIACKTGGLGAGPTVLTKGDTRAPLPRMAVSGKAAPDKIHDLFALFREILLEAKLDDKERFSRMVLEEKARLEHALVPSGHSLVSVRLRAAQSATGQMEELLGGVSHLLYLRELAGRVSSDWPGVLRDLETLRNLALARPNLTWNITSEEANKALLLDEAAGLAESLAAALLSAASATAPNAWTAANLPRREALLLPAQVNYVGRGGNLYDSGYGYHGSVHVIMKQLRTGWLWEKVRVQGGAYGAFCSFDRLTGSFALVSYRDPNVKNTIDVFGRTAEHLANISLSRRDLDAAIIGAIGEVDAYMLPDAKGMASFSRKLVGDTEESRQKMRDEIFGTTEGHFREFGAVMAKALEQGNTCVIGGATLEKHAASEQGWVSQKLL